MEFEQSIEFLQNIHHAGRWTLTAIGLKGEIVTSTFKDETDKRLLLWLNQYEGTHNIYYALNPLRRALESKAKREDVKCMAWLHVDIDPRDGYPIEEEKKRAMLMLKHPPNDIPIPTAVIFSGGGYQALWKLQIPVTIDGRSELYEDAKRYNQYLEQIFGGDNCHNVDRILRLPGTRNIPNAKKVAKGRKVTWAKLIHWNGRRVYPITDFIKVPEQQTKEKGFKPQIEVSGNIKRIMSLDEELPKSVSDQTKLWIARGYDPEDSSGHPSRSETEMAVCCNLVRAGVDDDTIYSLLTDKDWGISQSILEKGTNYHTYALRQIQRARDIAIHPDLAEMNNRHAVIGNYGGKPMVIEEVFDESINRLRMTKSTFTSIKERYCNQQVEIGVDKKTKLPITMPKGNWWLQHKNRNTYDYLTFAPGIQTKPSVYNLWKGFAKVPSPGDKHKRLLDHTFENICDGDSELFDYLINWTARAVQVPNEPGHTSIVLRGDQGVGKGVLASSIGELFGQHYLHISNSKHITGNFNSHLRTCSFLFADEAFFAANRGQLSSLKTLITEALMMSESKGVDSEIAGNFLHVLMASNDDWVIPAGINERRFCVIDATNSRIQNTDYFGKIVKDLQDGGYENFLNFLLLRDLSDFNVRKVPATQALQDQKINSFTTQEEWWFYKLQCGYVFDHDQSWPMQVQCSELVSNYQNHAKQVNAHYRASHTQIGKFLKKACPHIRRFQGHSVTHVEEFEGSRMEMATRPYYYSLPPLDQCRKLWDKNFGGPYDWSIPPDESIIVDQDII